MLYNKVRRRLDAPLNTLKAKFDVGDYWRWQELTKIDVAIDIHSLVFPLRYDIMIRKEFFEYYAENRSVYISKPSVFFEAMQGHPYYQWFSKVLATRYEPHLHDDPAAMQREFSKRVAASAAIYDSIINNGFDKSSPIVPHTAKHILPAESGRETGAKYYMGDGCHRLACLMSLGYQTLPHDYVRVKCFKRLTPLDNTALLARSISVNAEWLRDVHRRAASD